MPKHIYDSSFKYTPAVDTDLAKKFRRIQREMKAAKEQQQQQLPLVEPEVQSEPANVRPLKRRTG